MTIIPVIIAPDSRLKQKSEPVEKVDNNIRKLMDDMLKTMYHSNGIGLAAVQIGVHKRVLVMDLKWGSSRYKEEDEEKQTPEPIFLANPEIIYESEEINLYEEGCLSFPGQYANVERPKQVKVKYLDYNGVEQIIDCDELLATCIQHEIDHLDGIVFVDHISKLKRELIIRKLKKQQKDNS